MTYLIYQKYDDPRRGERRVAPFPRRTPPTPRLPSSISEDEFYGGNKNGRRVDHYHDNDDDD